MRALCCLFVAAALAVTVADARSVLANQRMLRQAEAGGATNPVIGATAIDKLSLANISGVWVGVGDQYDSDVWDAYFAEGTLPACGTKANFTYKHWGEPLPDSVALATNGSGPGVAVNGHQKDTYLWSEVTFDGAFLKYRPEWAPNETTCVRFVPYVDARNGMVYASVITKTEWKKNGNETAQTDMSCAVGAGETAGCFPQDDGSVHSVAVATYRCSSGACAGFAPGLVGKGEESA
ncbi:hypothetical protein COHA_009065 [Chlorella ohadii]|uniref:Uncharacterized protein n=1 Tax=Chlorella ohadii TaxID=2649997 RepID=A0AAD5GY68_9CHLO|nr:hypothetical protein COHA_009065 [Chlorella ohadii]